MSDQWGKYLRRTYAVMVLILFPLAWGIDRVFSPVPVTWAESRRDLIVAWKQTFWR